MEKKVGGNTPRSSTLARTITAIEERIATASVEHAVVLDEHGTLLVNKVGERREVVFTAEEVTRMRGVAVFIHNHPGGTSFSLPDILLAKRLNIQEMRVVTEEVLYVLRPPRAGLAHIGSPRPPQCGPCSRCRSRRTAQRAGP